MATDVKARLATGGTATSTTTLSDEADPATALTLKAAKDTFAQADLGSTTVQKTRSIFMAADQTLPSPITKTRLPRAAAPMITRPMFAIGFITAC